MKKLLTMILTVVLTCTLIACGETSQPVDDTTSDSYNIAIVKLVDHESLNEIADAIEAQFDKLAQDNGITIKHTVYSGQGDAASLQQIGDEIVNSNYDAIVPIATLTAQIMTNVADKESFVNEHFEIFDDVPDSYIYNADGTYTETKVTVLTNNSKAL